MDVNRSSSENMYRRDAAQAMPEANLVDLASERRDSSKVSRILGMLEEFRPKLHSVLQSLDGKDLNVHLEDLFKPQPGAVSEEFVEVLCAQAISDLGLAGAEARQMTRKIKAQLQECPTINTSGHHASFLYPASFQSHYLAAVGARTHGLPCVISLAASAVPLNNSDFPGGLFLRGTKVPIATGKELNACVYGHAPFSLEKWHGSSSRSGNRSSPLGIVESAAQALGAKIVLARLPLHFLQEVKEEYQAEFVTSLGQLVAADKSMPEVENRLTRTKKSFGLSNQAAKMLLKAVTEVKPLLLPIREEALVYASLADDRFFAAESLSQQITQFNYALWSKAFPKDEMPEQISIAIENLCPGLLELAIQQDDAVSRILFDPSLREEVFDTFKGIQGAWEYEQPGTHFFWGRNKKTGALENLTLVDDTLLGRSTNIQFNPESVCSALRSKDLSPSILTTMLLLNSHGIRCLGGYNQVDYLGRMIEKARVIISNNDLKQPHTRFEDVKTDGFLYGPAVAVDWDVSGKAQIASLDAILRNASPMKSSLEQNLRLDTVSTTLLGLVPELPMIVPRDLPNGQREKLLAPLQIDSLAQEISLRFDRSETPSPARSSRSARVAPPEAYGESMILRYISQRIGKTPLIQAPDLGETLLGTSALFIKNDGANPTLTHKDRIALAHVLDAQRDEATGLSAATCGNYGVALARACQLGSKGNKGKKNDPLECVLHVPAGFFLEREDQLVDFGARIVRCPGTYEDAVDVSIAYASERGFYDANPGSPKNTAIQMAAYSTIAFEIYEQLGQLPYAVAVPVSNGTTIAGIHQGFQIIVEGLRDLGFDATIPRMIAGSSKGLNPIITSFEEGKKECARLDRTLIENADTPVNEPLLNWRSFDGAEALAAIYDSNGFVYGAQDDELLDMRALLLKTMTMRGERPLSALPAGVAGLKALEQHKSKLNLSISSGPVVACITGNQALADFHS